MTIERCDLKGIVFDELVADDANVHIERMSNSHIWMAVESAGKRLVLNFSVHKRSLNVTVANEPPAYSSPETCACTPGDAFACRRATPGTGCICDCHDANGSPAVETPTVYASHLHERHADSCAMKDGSSRCTCGGALL